MATALRLCARAIKLADQYEETFNAQRLLRNAATARGQPRRLGVVGGNASGKSCFLNILLQMALADGDEAYRARGAGEQPGLSLLSSRYGDWDAIQAAIREGDLAVQFNTRPSPDAEGAKHMQIVEGSLADYYSGQRSKFGRQKTSLLLPAAFILHDGPEVACLVIPRSAAALDSEIDEVMRSLLVLAQDETEIGELTKSKEFSQQHAQLKHCTGIDVLAESKASGTSLETVLLGLMEQSGNGSLLLPELQKLASQLKPSAFIGRRQHLGSDLRYVKDVLEQPLRSMVDLCCSDDPPPDELLTVDVLGMMVEKIEVTAPFENHGLLHLMDMPGLSDTRPWANYNISKAISASTDLLVLINRNLRGDEPALQCLIYSGFAAQALERNSRSHLIICHNPERHNSGLNAEDLWSGQYEQDMRENHAASREVLAERLLMVAPPQLSEADQRAAVERFLNERCHFITVAPANCLSLMLANPQDVFEWLQRDEDVEMGANVNPIGAHNRLLERTQMAKLQEIHGTISSFQKAQQLGLLKDEVDRQHQNLKDSEGTADALTEEQTKTFVPQLKAKKSDPAKLAGFVAAGNAFQPSRRGQAEGRTMQSVAAALEAKLLAEPLESWVRDYGAVQMSDGALCGPDALISALKAVREQLPELLKQQLRAHVHNELFSEDQLFISVRSRSHGLARKEMGRHAGDANGAEGQAGDAADSGAQQAAAPAAAGTATTPAGRRSRAKKTRPLAETYERQASLWRALYRFVCDAHDIVVGQEAQNAQRRAALLRELEDMQGELEGAIEMYSGRAGYDELHRQMQRSLLHTMLQRKRLAQVLADSPEVSVHAEPLAFEVDLVHLPGGGYAVQGRTFTATLGDLALPAGLQEDFDALRDLLCGMLLQQHGLVWRREHPIPAGPDNALKAGYSCLTGRLLKPDSGLKKVRDIVAKQMFEEGEEALGLKLERAGLLPAPVGQQQPLAYILDFADGARYAGLLELQELAAACLKEDEAFLVWSTARLDGGRFCAYLLPATPLATSGPAQRTIKAYPMMLFGGMVDGVVRPVFEPLFKASREVFSLGAPQASQLSQGEGRGKRARSTSGTLVGDSTQPALSTASGEAGPSNAAVPGGAQRSVSRPTRAVRWKDENEVAAILYGLARTGGGLRGPPDASDEAGPSKRGRR